MARTLVFPNSIYTSRVREEHVVLPTLNDVVRVGVSRLTLPDTRDLLVRYHVDVSFDAGATWRLLCGADTSGLPTMPSLLGLDLTESWIETACPEPDNPARRLRVVFEPFEALRLAVFVEASVRGVRVQPPEEPHSVAFDAASSVSMASVQNPSWTHTPVGTPTSVGVGIGSFEWTGADLVDITSVTYGGTGCTAAISRKDTTTVYRRAAIYGLGSPAAGAQTVQVNFASPDQYGTAGSITVTGSDPATIFSNTAGAGTTDASPTVTCTTAADELVMDVVFVWVFINPTLTVGANQTQRWNHSPYLSIVGAGSTQAGSDGGVMSWTINLSGNWTQAAASFKAAGAAGYVPSRLHMSGGALPMTGGLFQ